MRIIGLSFLALFGLGAAIIVVILSWWNKQIHSSVGSSYAAVQTNQSAHSASSSKLHTQVLDESQLSFKPMVKTQASAVLRYTRTSNAVDGTAELLSFSGKEIPELWLIGRAEQDLGEFQQGKGSLFINISIPVSLLPAQLIVALKNGQKIGETLFQVNVP